MDGTNHLLSSIFALLLLTFVLIALIGFGLMVLIKRLLNRPAGATYDQAFLQNVDKAIERLGQATQHHVEVNAVLALTERLNNDPALMRNLAEHSRQVVAAALMLRVNSFAAQLKHAQQKLEDARQAATNYGGQAWLSDVTRLEALCTTLMQQLQTANDAVQSFNRPRAV